MANRGLSRGSTSQSGSRAPSPRSKSFVQAATLPAILAACSCLLSLALPQRAHASASAAEESGQAHRNSAGSTKPDPAVQHKILANYGKLPLSFEANQGQTDPSVKFLSRASGYTLFLTENGAVLAQRGARRDPKDRNSERGTRHLSAANPGAAAEDKLTLSMGLVGANRAAVVKGAEELPGKSNYFIGNDPKKWRTNVSTYAKVKYEDVYPGVDLVYYGNQGQLEYDLVVAPGADPSPIAFELGAICEPPRQCPEPLRLDRSGDLVVETGSGGIRFRKPVAYQLGRSGEKRYVEATYAVEVSESKSWKPESKIRFQLAPYDSSAPLVIDPVLAYSTYLGGNGLDKVSGIVVTSSGEATVVGSTNSTNFPVAANAFQPAFGGGEYDALVTQLSANGRSLIFSTYLGGNDDDESWGVGLDAEDNVYVSGLTASLNFPTTANAYSTAFNGTGDDSFLTKLNPTGSSLLYSTYIGPVYQGAGNVHLGEFLVTNSTGKAYIEGVTDSVGFPVTPGAYQPTLAGSKDAILTIIDTTQSGSASLAYSTYLGGTGWDEGHGVALDASGNVYLTGVTYSLNYPVTAGAYQASCKLNSSNQCEGQTFMSKINPGGQGSADLLYSTYFGGSATNNGASVGVDTSGDAYVTGDTTSTDMPTTPGAFQPNCNTTLGTCNNSFIAKFNPAGQGNADLVYSTYFGGSGIEVTKGLVVDLANNAYVTGRTTSTDFPTKSPLQAAHAAGNGSIPIRPLTRLASMSPLSEGNDGFVLELNPTGTALQFSTYLGGTQLDSLNAIALDNHDNIYVGGRTSSTDYPTTAGAFQTAHYPDNGTFDAVVGKIAPLSAAGIAFGPASLTLSALVGTTSLPQTITLLAAGSTSPLTLTSVLASRSFSETNTCGQSVPSGSTCAVTVTFTPALAGTVAGGLLFADGGPGSHQTIHLVGIGTFVQLVPTSLNFGDQKVGTTSTGQNVTLTNTGRSPLTINSIDITGTGAGDFADTNTCGSSVLPGAACSITITFTPTATGLFSAEASVSDSDAGSPQVVSLSGAGTQ